MINVNSDIIDSNPWIGLRTYSEGEIIYGRSEEIIILTQQIIQNNQTVVCGKSGIGKSSILRAGVFPIVRKHGIFPIHIRLSHNSDESYLDQIKNEIKKAVDDSNGEITAIELVKQPDDEELWDFFHRIEYRNKNGELLKPLIVLDQFEEIFTLEKDPDKVKRFFSELTALINNNMPEKHFAVDSVDEKRSDQSDDLFISFDTDCYSYNTESNFHLVLTLRDDFLFYLERFAPNIPALKNNRYCLMPINIKQAIEIMTQPREGLINQDVAKLIIEKLVASKDGDLNSSSIDSAILSLYLSRIYDKMSELGETEIKENLVNTYGADIIEEFYQESVEELSEDSKEWIEDNLINSDGRRDNQDIKKAMEIGKISKEQMDRLLHKSRLLRDFTYCGVQRVELIHDVLCNVVAKRKIERAENLQKLAFEQNAKKEKKRFRIRTSLIAIGIIAVVIGVSIWIIDKNRLVKVVDQQQNLVLSMEETHNVKDVDFWRAVLTVTGRYESGRDTVLLSKSINKSDVMDSYTIETDSCISINFSLDFGDFADIGKYINVSDEIPIADIMQSPYVKLKIDRDLPDLISYKGSVILDAGDVSIPIENAILMLGEAVSFTDSVGNFNILVEESTKGNNSLFIAKRGLGCYELPVITSEGANEEKLYRIMPTDSLRQFNDMVMELDTITKWNFSTVGSGYCANKGSSNGVYVKFEDGHEDRLKMYWRKGEIIQDKVMLSGYFFFNDEKDKLDRKGAGKYAYYIGNGYIDNKEKKDENNASYRNFEFKGYDAAGNIRTITGKYYKVAGRSAGKYTGDITSVKRQLASFGHVVN